MTTDSRSALRELPLGAIRPAGWLRRQLRLQADGQTGHLEELWPDVGPDNAWLGGDGDDWERGPYYLDGLIPLAWQLEDAALQAKARTWIEAILASQREDGQFGPTTNDDWWPRMVALKALTQFADATDDPRVAPFLLRYFEFQARELPGRPLAGWGRMRGAENALSVLWLHASVGGDWLIALGSLLMRQTADWENHLLGELSPNPATSFAHQSHGPNVAMGLKNPVLRFLLDGDDVHRDTAAAMLANVHRLHGLANGMFSGDEWLAGRSPHHGTETCQVVEYLYTLEQLVRVFGDGSYGDDLETVAFNALAASNDASMLGHQYHQQPNQVLVSFDQRDWTFSGDDANVFGLEPHFGCCTANLHQGWPKFTRSLWMRSGGRSLTAVSYAPCEVDATIAGTTIQLRVDTDYPFEETVRIAVTAHGADEIALRLRIPQWCTEASIELNGAAVPAEVDSQGFATVSRVWVTGDDIRLTCPMRVRKLDRDRGAAALRLGPLVLVHGVEEVWREVPGGRGLGEWEVTPRKSWNLGLWPGQMETWRIERQPSGQRPFGRESVPVTVFGHGARLPEWRLERGSAGPLPESPVTTSQPVEDIVLVPYGSSRVRVTEFPVVRPPAGAATGFDVYE